MQPSRIPYASTGKFSGLIKDFLDQKEPIRSFFGNMPSLLGFENQLALKSGFEQVRRDVLIESLKKQYTHLNLQGDEAADIVKRINLLQQKNTFTVTTGHQLCLFTGPLYTVYKIVHTIKLAEELAAKFPQHNFVPIFWMATEDHDFEEVNHIHLNGHKIVWHATPGDAVGRMSTAGISKAIDELAFRLLEGDRTAGLLDDLRDAYEKHKNLADATRALVHKWFGQRGLLIVDGDDAELKKAMIPAFKRELLENLSFHAVEETNQKLAENFKIQVTPREINLFYLRDGMRTRIVETDGRFSALNTDFSWNENEILAELDNHPERFSPNVLLRPLYQETILPNLAYIGGGGEVAYWAEMKDMFDAFDVPFPIVMLRQSMQFEPKRLARKRQKLQLSFEELFQEYHIVANELIKRNCDYEAELAPQREKLIAAFAAIKTLATSTDKTLEKTVEAQKTQMLNKLMQLEKKMIRAAKRKDNDGLRMLQEWQNEMMPGGGLQERHDNILQHLVSFGDDFWSSLFKNVEPLNFEFLVLTEE